MTVLLAPTTRKAAAKVGGRTYRKQILKAGRITYRPADGGEPRQLEFNEEMFADLARAFREGAYDAVKIFAVDGQNRHNSDPDRMRGSVVDLVPSADGLDAIVQLSEDAAALVDEHPDLGVSARVVQGYQRSDGKSWPHALEHVVLTTNPQVTGMSPWTSADLSNPVGHAVIDLSTETLEGDPMSGLSDEDVDRIAAALADKMGGGGGGSAVGQPPAADDDAPVDWGDFFEDDVDVEALAQFLAEQDDEEAGEPVGAGAGAADLSLVHTDPAIIDLTAQNAALVQTVQQMQATNAASQWEAERSRLAMQGVPPRLLDLAAPVLSAAAAGAVIDLSTPAGEQVNVVKVVRDLLHEAAGVIDLSGPIGHGQGPDKRTDPHDTSALHAAWDAEFGKGL